MLRFVFIWNSDGFSSEHIIASVEYSPPPHNNLKSNYSIVKRPRRSLFAIICTVQYTLGHICAESNSYTLFKLIKVPNSKDDMLPSTYIT